MSPGYRLGMSPGYRLGISPGYRLGMSPRYRLGMSPRYRLGMSPGYRLGMSPGYRLGMSPGYRLGMSPGYRLGYCLYSTLTMRAVRLSLNTAGASGRNVNCWKSVDWMKALACTHFACSTVTFRPLLLTKQVAICSESR